MLLDFALPDHERRLIPEGRISGPMPWVIAIMLFLTLLSAAAGLLLADAARQGGDDLVQRSAVTLKLRRLAGITEVKPVPDAEVRNLLEPWLGSGVADAEIPIPALVDVIFDRPPDAAQLKTLQGRLRSIAPTTKIDSHAAWMAPFFELMRALVWLAVGVLLLLLLATSATVVLAVRSTLNTHRETIEIMHMMGGTDLQAARLFQRRVGLDALLGGFIGFIAAGVVIWLLGGRFASVEPGLLSGAGFPWYGWIVLALIPLVVTGLAMLIARTTVISALKKML
jgi:cell division transport system permease protein